MTMKFIIIAWIQFFSAEYNLDPVLVEAIVKTESEYNYMATGGIGEVGLLQMRHEYLDRPTKYYNPHQNLKEGIKRLAELKKLENQLGQYWFVAWNMGATGALKYHKKHGIKNFIYGKKVFKNYHVLKTQRKATPLLINSYTASYDARAKLLPVE